jgi:hypothetical protein
LPVRPALTFLRSLDHYYAGEGLAILARAEEKISKALAILEEN